MTDDPTRHGDGPDWVLFDESKGWRNDVRPLSVPDLLVMAEHTCEDLEAMREDIAVLRHSTVESATALELYGIGDDLMQAWAKVQQVRTALEAYGATHG